MADIVLYDEAGEPVTYENVETLTTDTPTEGETVTFTLGEVMDGLEVELNLADGDQTVTVPEGKLLKDLTLKKPDTLRAGNIAKGISIAGVTGDIEKAPAGILDGMGVFSVTDALFLSPPQRIRSSAFTSAQITAISMSQVSTIGSWAFWGCSHLTDISFPKCTSIGSSAFKYFNTMTPTPIKEAVFPECTYIGQEAFAGCTTLSIISFPKCTKIERGAFSGYNGSNYLNNRGISIAEFPKCTSVLDNAFCGCRSLLTASFPLLSYIYSWAFGWCDKLQTAYFPSCSYVGAYAFYHDNYLKTACFDNVIIAYDLAFWNINGWSSLSFPKLQSASSQCFAYNYWLRQIYLPQLSSVGYMAFYGCTRVETVSLPKCRTISALAFASCNALKSFYLLGDSVTQLNGSTVFSSTPLSNSSYLGGYGSIFVKESLLLSYQVAAGWSYYMSRLVGLTDDEIDQLDAERENDEITDFDTTV